MAYKRREGNLRRP